MSWAKRIWANSQAKDSRRLVMLALGELADKDGVCSAPTELLADLCRIRVRQVQYDLKRQVECGELLPLSSGKGGRGAATVYRITLPNIAPFPVPKRVQSMKGVLGAEVMSQIAPFYSRAGAGNKAAPIIREEKTDASANGEQSPFDHPQT